MKRVVRYHLGCVAAMLTLSVSSTVAYAADPPKCDNIDRLSRATADTLNYTEQKYRDLDECIKQGWDPPVAWRPYMGRGRGTTSNMSGGIFVTGLCPPDNGCPSYDPGFMPGGGSLGDDIGNPIAVPSQTNTPEVQSPWEQAPTQLPGQGMDF